MISSYKIYTIISLNYWIPKDLFWKCFPLNRRKGRYINKYKSSGPKTPSKVNHSTAIKNYTVGNIDRFILML